VLRFVIKLFIVFGCCIVFYFSWEPNPNIGLKPYFPHWLGAWTNKNGNLRTAVPFIFLGALLELGFVNIQENWKKRINILILLTVIVFIAELGQLFLPQRHFDIADILWGIFGSMIGLYVGNISKRILSR
jgi:glycopeptide antibiotics resistance protein